MVTYAQYVWFCRKSNNISSTMCRIVNILKFAYSLVRFNEILFPIKNTSFYNMYCKHEQDVGSTKP